MPLADDVALLANVPAQLSETERLFLYSSVLSFRPTTCLEIGAYKGGSTTIIALALDRLGRGQLFSIDPWHRIAAGDFEKIAHRTTLVRGQSPEAVRKLGEDGLRWDFVFVDGNHDLVAADCAGIYPFLAEEALVLFHDAHYSVVAKAIDEWVGDHAAEMFDHGIVDKSCNTLYQPPERFGGLRAVTRRKATSAAGRCLHPSNSAGAGWRLFL